MASTSDNLSEGSGSTPDLRSETPEEAAARWRREDAGRQDVYGAKVINSRRMDRLTAESIAAQRDWADRVGGESRETLADWSERNNGDVGDWEVQATRPPWGAWLKGAVKLYPDRVVVVYVSGRPVGWTTGREIKQERYFRSTAPVPNYCQPIEDLHDLASL